MKIRSVGAVLFHADGQRANRQRYRGTDIMKLPIVFHSFSNAP